LEIDLSHYHFYFNKDYKNPKIREALYRFVIENINKKGEWNNEKEEKIISLNLGFFCIS
jgi:hypothetical protein